MSDPRINSARAGLIRNQPFFGTLAMYLTLIEDEKCETSAVDGENLFYAPSYIATLTPSKLQGMLAHLVCHCILKHHLRRGHRDADLWDQACDYAVNIYLTDSKFDLPDGGLIDKQYRGMAAEEIYARLRNQPQPQGGGNDGQQGQPQTDKSDLPGDAGDEDGDSPGGDDDQSGDDGQAGQGEEAEGSVGSPQQGQGKASSQAGGQPRPGKGSDASEGQGSVGTPKSPGPGNWGRVLDGAKPADETKINQASAEWDHRTRQALSVAAARNAGHIPGNLLGIADEVKTQRSDWTAGLFRFIDDRVNTDQSWEKPNKRMLSSGFVFPGTIPDGIRKLGVVIDVSASVNEHLLGLFLARLRDAVGEVAIEEIIVMQCDAAVKKIDVFFNGEEIKIQIVGRGGTKFSPALDWFVKNEPDVAALMYFTDLECTDYGPDPGIPLLWAAYGYESTLKPLIAKVPFGEVIMVTE